MKILGELTSEKVVWGLGIGLVTFVVSLVGVSLLIVYLPADYFTRKSTRWGEQHPALRWTFLILKNLLGAVIIVAGVMMLVLPGQGVLTIVIGVMLLNFPGKRQLVRKLIGHPRVLGPINKLRARFGKPPFVLEARKGQQQPASTKSS